jgi:hypothetical protein
MTQIGSCLGKTIGRLAKRQQESGFRVVSRWTLRATWVVLAVLIAHSAGWAQERRSLAYGEAIAGSVVAVSKRSRSPSMTDSRALLSLGVWEQPNTKPG